MANEARQDVDGTALEVSGAIAEHDDCCCGGTINDCDDADSYTGSLTVTISGIVDTSCIIYPCITGTFPDNGREDHSCSDLNGTYTLPNTAANVWEDCLTLCDTSYLDGSDPPHTWYSNVSKRITAQICLGSSTNISVTAKMIKAVDSSTAPPDACDGTGYFTPLICFSRSESFTGLPQTINDTATSCPSGRAGHSGSALIEA